MIIMVFGFVFPNLVRPLQVASKLNSKLNFGWLLEPLYLQILSCFCIQKKTTQRGSVAAQSVLSLLVKSSPSSDCGADPCLRGQFWQLCPIYIEATNLEPCLEVGRKWGRGKNLICIRKGNYLYFLNLARPLQVASKPTFLPSSVPAV